MRIRLAKKSDIWLLYNWVNKIDSIKNKLLTNKKISKIDHKVWYENSLKSKNRYIWIIENKNMAIGQLRFDINEDDKLCFIDIYIDKEHRKNNFGQKAINQAIDFISQKYTLDYIIALVLKKNIKSLNFFYSLGFGKYYDVDTYCELRLNVEKNNEK
ncbi:GNAT family N-acetyltransferase [Alphaproteobacteria bacterium]|nr:GNAT family N-acetyltransferase [Alphaproteobacteria bacterium]